MPKVLNYSEQGAFASTIVRSPTSTSAKGPFQEFKKEHILIEGTALGYPRSPRNGGGLCEGGGANKISSENKGRRGLLEPALEIDAWEKLGDISISSAAKSSSPILGFPRVCGIYEAFGVKLRKSTYPSGSQSPLSELQPERANI